MACIKDTKVLFYIRYHHGPFPLFSHCNYTVKSIVLIIVSMVTKMNTNEETAIKRQNKGINPFDHALRN